MKTSKSELKASQIFDLSEEKLKFEDMLVMTRLWEDYMKSLLGTIDTKPTELLSKLSKADFHGALI